jgi:hypothetical protein
MGLRGRFPANPTILGLAAFLANALEPNPDEVVSIAPRIAPRVLKIRAKTVQSGPSRVSIRQTRRRVSQALQEPVHRQVRDSTRLNRISIKPSAVSCVSRTWLVPGSPPWAVNRAGRLEMANGDVASRPGRPTHLGFRISFGPQHSGKEIRQSAQAKAERIVRRGRGLQHGQFPTCGPCALTRRPVCRIFTLAPDCREEEVLVFQLLPFESR